MSDQLESNTIDAVIEPFSKVYLSNLNNIRQYRSKLTNQKKNNFFDSREVPSFNVLSKNQSDLHSSQKNFGLVMPLHTTYRSRANSRDNSLDVSEKINNNLNVLKEKMESLALQKEFRDKLITRSKSFSRESSLARNSKIDANYPNDNHSETRGRSKSRDEDSLPKRSTRRRTHSLSNLSTTNPMDSKEINKILMKGQSFDKEIELLNNVIANRRVKEEEIRVMEEAFDKFVETKHQLPWIPSGKGAKHLESTHKAINRSGYRRGLMKKAWTRCPWPQQILPLDKVDPSHSNEEVDEAEEDFRTQDRLSITSSNSSTTGLHEEALRNVQTELELIKPLLLSLTQNTGFQDRLLNFTSPSIHRTSLNPRAASMEKIQDVTSSEAVTNHPLNINSSDQITLKIRIINDNLDDLMIAKRVLKKKRMKKKKHGKKSKRRSQTSPDTRSKSSPSKSLTIHISQDKMMKDRINEGNPSPLTTFTTVTNGSHPFTSNDDYDASIGLSTSNVPSYCSDTESSIARKRSLHHHLQSKPASPQLDHGMDFRLSNSDPEDIQPQSPSGASGYSFHMTNKTFSNKFLHAGIKYGLLTVNRIITQSDLMHQIEQQFHIHHRISDLCIEKMSGYTTLHTNTRCLYVLSLGSLPDTVFFEEGCEITVYLMGQYEYVLLQQQATTQQQSQQIQEELQKSFMSLGRHSCDLLDDFHQTLSIVNRESPIQLTSPSAVVPSPVVRSILNPTSSTGNSLKQDHPQSHLPATPAFYLSRPTELFTTSSSSIDQFEPQAVIGKAGSYLESFILEQSQAIQPSSESGYNPPKLPNDCILPLLPCEFEPSTDDNPVEEVAVGKSHAIIKPLVKSPSERKIIPRRLDSRYNMLASPREYQEHREYEDPELMETHHHDDFVLVQPIMKHDERSRDHVKKELPPSPDHPTHWQQQAIGSTMTPEFSSRHPNLFQEDDHGSEYSSILDDITLSSAPPPLTSRTLKMNQSKDEDEELDHPIEFSIISVNQNATGNNSFSMPPPPIRRIGIRERVNNMLFMNKTPSKVVVPPSVSNDPVDTTSNSTLTRSELLLQRIKSREDTSTTNDTNRIQNSQKGNFINEKLDAHSPIHPEYSNNRSKVKLIEHDPIIDDYDVEKWNNILTVLDAKNALTSGVRQDMKKQEIIQNITELQPKQPHAIGMNESTAIDNGASNRRGRQVVFDLNTLLTDL